MRKGGGQTLNPAQSFKRIATWNIQLSFSFLVQGRLQRSLRLPHYLAQVKRPPLQPPPAGLADAPEVAKEENCCWVRGEPQ